MSVGYRSGVSSEDYGSLDEGACLHALRTGEVADVPDAEAEARWPLYMEAARAQGLRSLLTLPLIVQDRPVGAMNLHSFDTKHEFDGETRRQADVFAAQASTALLLAMRQLKSGETARQLEAALTSRSVIDQAMGILMGQQQCGPDEAITLLRTHSQNNNRKLRLVAEELVARTGRGTVSSAARLRRPKTLADRSDGE